VSGGPPSPGEGYSLAIVEGVLLLALAGAFIAARRRVIG
jgi:hypothetical protein